MGGGVDGRCGWEVWRGGAEFRGRVGEEFHGSVGEEFHGSVGGGLA